MNIMKGRRACFTFSMTNIAKLAITVLCYMSLLSRERNGNNKTLHNTSLGQSLKCWKALGYCW